MRSLVEKIREEYLDGVELSGCEKREDVAKRYDDIFALFTLGLKTKDTALMRTTLDIINKYQRSVYRIEADRDNERRGAICAYAEFYADLEKAEKGELEDKGTLARTFCPFCFSPSEMFDIYRRIGERNPSFEPMRELFDGVREIIQALSISSTYIYDVDETLKEDALSFVIPWLDEFWPLFEEKKDEFVSSDFGYSSPFIEIVNCLCDMTYNTRFDNSFKTLFNYLKKCVEKFGWGRDGVLWPDELEGIIRNAIWHDDFSSFDIAYTEALESGIDVKIDAYPKENIKILRKILSFGKCLPGTREGRVAFFDMIKHDDPAFEIIRLTVHPSYYSDGVSPLAVALKNDNLDPEKYPLLLPSPNLLTPEDEIELLALAYYSGKREKVDSIIFTASDPEWRDKDGNNVMHRVLNMDNVSLEKVIEIAPSAYFSERNNEGNTPLDIYFSLSTLM